jgi:hypothetical protein
MTNEQTLILLKSLKSRLDAAVEKSETLMPDSERVTVKRHGGSTSAAFCLAFKCSHPTHFYEATEIPALDPIYEVIESLQADIDLLTPKDEKKRKTA